MELEHQNHDLLESMNTRTRMHFQLQHSVEILSIAATTYHSVGLVADVTRGVVWLNAALNPEVVTALAVPIVFTLVTAAFLVIRRIPQRDRVFRSSC